VKDGNYFLLARYTLACLPQRITSLLASVHHHTDSLDLTTYVKIISVYVFQVIVVFSVAQTF